jgi:hypothetical protein
MRSNTTEAVRAHLGSCSDCREFAQRLGLAQEALREHHGRHRPDAYFAQRVTASLPEAPDLIGWAAMRLLPATLAAALVLSVWCWAATPGPTSLVEESPTDDLLAWVIEEDDS